MIFYRFGHRSYFSGLVPPQPGRLITTWSSRAISAVQLEHRIICIAWNMDLQEIMYVSSEVHLFQAVYQNQNMRYLKNRGLRNKELKMN